MINNLFISYYKIAQRFSNKTTVYTATLGLSLSAILWVFLILIYWRRQSNQDIFSTPHFKGYFVVSELIFLFSLYLFFRKKNIQSLIEEFENKSMFSKDFWMVFVILLTLVPIVWIALIL